MRLINADALLKKLNDNSIEYDAYVNNFILNAPTVYAMPVIHAHWIKGAFRTITCSNCGFLLRVPDAIIPKFAYCPHCGAKMDENEDE